LVNLLTDREQQRVEEMHKVAHTANRLLKRILAYIDTDQPLRTPTAHQWQRILTSLNCVLKLHHLLSGLHVTPGSSQQVALLKLQHELSHLPFCLAATHLSNMELDVSSLMR